MVETYHWKGLPQSEMARMYASADIFVDGQWHAGWNNPVAEAMACKVPVVCTDIGGVADFAFHEKTSLLVPARNPKAMANAIIRLVRDESLRNSLSERGYRHIVQFDWDESARKLPIPAHVKISILSCQPITSVSWMLGAVPVRLGSRWHFGTMQR